MKAQHVINRTSENIPPDGYAPFAEKLAGAVAELKYRLEERYERAHPGQAELVCSAIAEAEALAWELSFFPHLFLPDLVEARIAQLALQPASARSEAAFAHAASSGCKPENLPASVNY
jgi:hypothetical protein